MSAEGLKLIPAKGIQLMLMRPQRGVRGGKRRGQVRKGRQEGGKTRPRGEKGGEEDVGQKTVQRETEQREKERGKREGVKEEGKVLGGRRKQVGMKPPFQPDLGYRRWGEKQKQRNSCWMEFPSWHSGQQI